VKNSLAGNLETKMFRTKKDVDKHVQDINSKIKSSSERNLKGYSIAKLYFGVEDYENARRYLLPT